MGTLTAGTEGPQRSPLLDELLKFISPASANVPRVLYHYTSAESLRKILETNCLLATHFEFTNDPTELRHGHHLVVKEMKRTLEERKGTWAVAILTRVLEKMETEGFHEQTPTFVTCFSQHEDSLGQWRAYAQDGRGYAIGFDTPKWESEKSNGDDLGVELVQCSYKTEEMEELLREQQRHILDRGLELKQKYWAPQAEPDLDFEKALFLAGAFACLRLKHVGFEDEAEWRLVALPNEAELSKPDCRHVREVGGVFAPAVKMRLSRDGQRLPLRRIVRGPYHAQEERKKSAAYGLSELLKLMGYDPTRTDFIKKSRIQYRARL